MMNVARALTIAVLLSGPAAAAAQEMSLSAARELYVAAEYTNALGMLTDLANAKPPAADRQTIDLYRALCLVALGNGTEANALIEAMLTADPLYRPEVADLPPRVRSAFTDARKRLLPSLVQQRYLVARAAYEQKEYAVAAEGFKFVMSGLADPDITPAGGQSPLSDLKVLASGFHDLAAKAAAPVEPVVEPPAPVAPVAAPVPAAPVIYDASNAAVVPPQTIRQVAPAFPGRVVAGGVATIDIIVNETGGVESAMVVTSLNAQYDRLALNAAKTWQYQPATLNGTPVKYRKRLQLTVVPDATRR